MLTIRHDDAQGNRVIEYDPVPGPDPCRDGLLVLTLADGLYLPGNARRRRTVTEGTAASFTLRGRKAPMFLRRSVTKVTVEGRHAGRPYRAEYAVEPLPLRPVCLQVPRPNVLRARWVEVYGPAAERPAWLFGARRPVWADYAHQVFRAAWCHDPFEKGYLLLCLDEELPIDEDDREAKTGAHGMCLAMARMRPEFDRYGLRVTGANLRYARLRLVGERVKSSAVGPVTATPATKQKGRRR